MGAPTHSSHRIRRDGWTAGRQLKFLDALARTRSVTRAAAFAGMSRESAYRLRKRGEGALFAAAWDRAMKELASSPSKGHILGSPASRRRRPHAPISSGNPPKVTKSTKYTTPRFDALLGQLRDVMSPTS